MISCAFRVCLYKKCASSEKTILNIQILAVFDCTFRAWSIYAVHF